MSASREKKNRQEQVASGYVDPKTAKAEEARKAERRSAAVYTVIAVVFVALLIATLVWRSNVVPRNTKAVTIDGQSYSAAEVQFHYQNAYRAFLNQYSYYLSYIGLDTSVDPKDQTIGSTAASLLQIEEGGTWYDYFLDQGIKEMTSVQRGLDKAKEENFVFPDSVKTTYDESMASLKETAKASGLSVSEYLKRALGDLMTKSVYEKQLLRLIQFDAYSDAYSDSLTYTDEELEAEYAEEKNSYDVASWEYVVIDGTAQSTEDADGNTIEPSEEEQDEALEAAHLKAEAILASYQAGESLEALAESDDAAYYYSEDAATYYGDATSEWLFDEARREGDVDIIAVGSSYYVALFHSCGRDESETVDVRHILITPEDGTLSSEDEGYDAEQEKLKAAALEKAEAILDEWKAGEATEDSFAELAREYTADSNGAEGGLYTQVYQGQMVETFNDWCFDPARQSGDTGIVETSYGAHVMYFVGPNAARWKTQVTNHLKSHALEDWQEALIADAAVERFERGINSVA